MKKTLRKLMTSAVMALGLSVMLPATSAQAQQGGVFMAQVLAFGGNFAPRSWAYCDGQLLPIASYSALFSLLGTTYGGDGRTTFALPDLRGRAPLHPGSGPGLSTYRLGAKGGVEAVFLSLVQLPSHQHSPQLKGTSGAAAVLTPAANMLAARAAAAYAATGGRATLDSTLANGSVVDQAVGGNLSHENRPPYIAVNFIIALEGLYPSRS